MAALLHQPLARTPRDHGHVAATDDRLLRLAVKQESKGRLETALRRMLAGPTRTCGG